MLIRNIFKPVIGGAAQADEIESRNDLAFTFLPLLSQIGTFTSCAKYHNFYIYRGVFRWKFSEREIELRVLLSRVLSCEAFQAL